jgi:hypothetical protein
MAEMMRRATDRMPAESFRTDSHQLRIDAKGAFLSAVNETRTLMGKTVEAMAIDAGCSVSAMSDALSGKDSRNFAGHWLIAQGPEFVAKHNAIVDKKLGLTPASVDAQEAEDIGRLVQRLVLRGFRSRSEAAS